MNAAPTGYSGTPLWKKLGIREGCRVGAVNAPAEYLDWLQPLPERVQFDKVIGIETDLVHLFCDGKSKLKTKLASLRKTIKADVSFGFPGRKRRRKSPRTSPKIRSASWHYRWASWT